MFPGSHLPGYPRVLYPGLQSPPQWVLPTPLPIFYTNPNHNHTLPLISPFCCCCFNTQASLCLGFVVKALWSDQRLFIIARLLPTLSGRRLNVTSAEHSCPSAFSSSSTFLVCFKAFKIVPPLLLFIISVVFCIFPDVEGKLHKNKDLTYIVGCFIPGARAVLYNAETTSCTWLSSTWNVSTPNWDKIHPKFWRQKII